MGYENEIYRPNCYRVFGTLSKANGMKGRGFMLWVLLVPILLAGAIWLFWTIRYPVHTYRYKLTVEVETPEGLKTGHAVREVTWRRTPQITMESGVSETRQRGEAVAVDLPGGKTLFVLLDVNAYDTIRSVFHDAGGDNVKTLLDRATATGKVYVLPPPTALETGALKYEKYPRLATFADMTDPKSVASVNPTDLAASFDQGYRLISIIGQVTTEPVTIGIGGRLGWLSKYPEPSLNPKHNPQDFSASATLHHGDFRQGTYQ